MEDRVATGGRMEQRPVVADVADHDLRASRVPLGRQEVVERQGDTFPGQTLDEMPGDESAAAGDEDSHAALRCRERATNGTAGVRAYGATQAPAVTFPLHACRGSEQRIAHRAWCGGGGGGGGGTAGGGGGRAGRGTPRRRVREEQPKA